MMSEQQRMQCRVFVVKKKTALGETDSGEIVLIALRHHSLREGLIVGDVISFEPQTLQTTKRGRYELKYFAGFPRRIARPAHAAETVEENWAAHI
jgi:hypothetical protein